jgi:serine/threonine protein kinase
MNRELWGKVRDLFEAALDLNPEGRGPFLDRACAGDAALRAEVNALLEAHQNADFMNEPAGVAAASPLQPDPMEDRMIGPYKILRRIGSGGMASVYAAVRADQQFQKLVAIKLVRPGMDTRELLKRFLSERQVLAGLEHPNIARLLDGGTTPDGMPYLVMEYVEGVPLDAYCDSQKLSVSERLVLFQAVCRAVQYAHQSLVVHRDLKPSNILVTPERVPKLLDFGIAKLLRAGNLGQAVHLTRTNLRPMTPEYASPEQVRGEPVSTASDIYSLGVLLYRLLTGHSPYRLRTASLPDLQHAICLEEPVRPGKSIGPNNTVIELTPESVSQVREGRPDRLRRRLQGDLDVIVLTALRKEPQRRYASAERLGEDIERHLRGLPVSARKDTWRYRAGKFVARNKVGVAVAALVAVALLVSSAISIYYLRQMRAQRALTLQLASFMVLDFDEAMKSGVTSAREVFLNGVVSQLNEIYPDAARDPATRQLVIKAYLKAGDLQANLYEPNVGEVASARRSFQKALELAQLSVRANPQNRDAQLDLALAQRRLGDIAALEGDLRSALTKYRATQSMLESLIQAQPGKSQLLHDLLNIHYKVGLTLYELGDTAGALESYRLQLPLAERLARMEGMTPAVRREVALAEEHVGDMLAQSGRAPEALPHLRQAAAEYADLLKANPSSVSLRHDLGAVSLILGDTLDLAGKPEEAEAGYRRGFTLLDALRVEDPANQQYQREVNGALSRLSDTLIKLGRTPEARVYADQLLAMVKTLVNRSEPAAHDLHQYCWLLVTSKFPDQHDPPLALDVARRAVEKSKGSVPAILDCLARAYAENRDYDRAIETEQKVLASLPATRAGEPVSGDRAEYESNLQHFREASLRRSR